MSLVKNHSKEVKQILSKYPPEGKRSAVMPLLYLAQRAEGYVNKAAMQDIAQILQELVRAAQGTGQISADLHPIFASLLVVIQSVEADNRSDFGFSDFQNLRDVLHRGFVDIAFLMLGKVKQRHDRRAFMLRRVLG